jgi:hypothetical protein
MMEEGLHDGYIDYMENNGGIEPAEEEGHVDEANKSTRI